MTNSSRFLMSWLLDPDYQIQRLHRSDSVPRIREVCWQTLDETDAQRQGFHQKGTQRLQVKWNGRPRGQQTFNKVTEIPSWLEPYFSVESKPNGGLAKASFLLAFGRLYFDRLSGGNVKWALTGLKVALTSSWVRNYSTPFEISLSCTSKKLMHHLERKSAK